LRGPARVCHDGGMQTPGSPLPAPVLESTPGFGAGSVLARGFSVWASNLTLFLGVSFTCYLPLLLIPKANPADPASVTMSTALTILLTSIIGPLVSGAVIRGVFEQLRGGRSSFGDSLRVAFRSLWRMFCTGFLAGLIVLLFTLLLIVPGIMRFCSYYVAIPVTVVEGTGASESLSRSKKLAEGYRWHIFGILLVGMLLGMAIGACAGVVFRGISGPVQTLLVAVIPNAIMGSLAAVFSGVAYYQLRVAKEGIDIEQLAAVFD
jgi:hypothetical protein